MKCICNYSILRFLPYPETGEFVNIGIVLFTSSGDFRYQVETRRQRVTTFFPSLDAKIFQRARKEMNEEFARLSGHFTARSDDFDGLRSTFRHLIHPRETMMRFSEPGTLVETSPEAALKRLFDYYVKHSFATKEYQEVALEKQLGKLLSDSNLRQRYSEKKLGTADYPVKFPFVLVQGDAPVQAIKPIHLGHDEPSKIYEHGDAWVARIKRLDRANMLAQDTLFVAGPPLPGKPKLAQAYKEMAAELSSYDNVRVVSAEESKSHLIELIKQGMPDVTNAS